MVRRVRETCPRANVNPPNAPPFIIKMDSDTVGPEVQARFIAWCNGKCAQSQRSLFSALPSPEHSCWAQFLSQPMILDNQTTAANALGQPQHDIVGGSYPVVYYPQSTPAESDFSQVGLSNAWDRYHHAPSPIDNTLRRATSAQSTRPMLPRLVVDSSQVSRDACTATTDMWYSGGSADNDRYRFPLPDLLQPNYYQGRPPSSSGSEGCHSPGSDGSWVDIDAGDVMDTEWTETVPEERSHLDSRHRLEEVLRLGGRESKLGVETGFSLSGISNDSIRDEPISDIALAGLSHIPEPTHCRDAEARASHSGRQGRRASNARHDEDGVSTFNDSACLRCQLKRVTVSVPSVRVFEP